MKGACIGDSASSGASLLTELREGKRDASPVSISISGEDNALNILARSASEQDDSAELRRLIENTATEFGLQIHEIHLNGAASQSFKSFLGGNSGSRIR